MSESERIDPLLLGILDDRGADLIVSTSAPAAIPEFASIAHSRSSNPGRIVDDESSFVVRRTDRGYYNPLRVSKGTGAVNALFHETGHLLEFAYGPRGLDASVAFENAAQPYLRRWALAYAEPGRTLPETLTIARRELFAESFDRYVDSRGTRVVLRHDWPALAAYWDVFFARLPMMYEATTRRDLAEVCRVDALLRPLRAQAPPASHVR